MWEKNLSKSSNKRTVWDYYCINCNSFLGSTEPGESHRYERGGICPYCKKDINKKEDTEVSKNI